VVHLTSLLWPLDQSIHTSIPLKIKNWVHETSLERNRKLNYPLNYPITYVSFTIGKKNESKKKAISNTDASFTTIAEN